MHVEFLPPPSYELVHVNLPVLKTFRESFFNIMGRPLLSYVEPSKKIPFEQHIKNVISIGLPTLSHVGIVPVGQSPIRVLAVHLPIVDESGRIVKIVGYGRVVETKRRNES